MGDNFDTSAKKERGKILIDTFTVDVADITGKLFIRPEQGDELYSALYNSWEIHERVLHLDFTGVELKLTSKF